jgi:hypothetical protein
MPIDTATATHPHDHQPAAKALLKPVRRSTKLSPRAARGALLVLPSARTGEGRRLREFRADLTAHVGGKPNATQRALIDRATVLQHHLTAMDRKATAADGIMSDHASRQYLAWTGALSRLLRQLGLDATPPPKPKPLTPRQIMGLEPRPEGYAP